MRSCSSAWFGAMLLAVADLAIGQQPIPLSAELAAPHRLGSTDIKVMFNGLFCARSNREHVLLISDALLNAHLLESDNPYVWAGLAGYRLFRAKLTNRTNQELAAINESAENAIRVDGSVWETHWVLALVRIQQGRFSEAVILIRRAEKLGAPASSKALINAELAFARNNPAGAERALRDALGIERSPYFSDGILNVWLGRALQLQSRADEALTAFQSAERSLLPNRKDCFPQAQIGIAETTLFFKGDAIRAEPLIQKNQNLKDEPEFARLRDLLHFLKQADGLAVGNPTLTAEEAALELVKFPVGTKILAQLLQSGTLRSADIVDGTGNSLLILAAFANQPETASILLKAGANVNRANLDGRRALDIFCAQGSEAGVRLMLNARAITHYQSRNYTTPLAAAIASGSVAVVKQILSKTKSLDKGDINRLLIQSAYFGMSDIVKELVASGASINSSDPKRMPPLIAAVLSGNRELVKWLLANKADANSTYSGRSVIDFARDTDDPTMIQLIVGGKVTSA